MINDLRITKGCVSDLIDFVRSTAVIAQVHYSVNWLVRLGETEHLLIC